MVGYEGSSAGSYLVDLTCPIPSHCASIVATSTLRVNVHPYLSDHLCVLDIQTFTDKYKLCYTHWLYMLTGR